MDDFAHAAGVGLKWLTLINVLAATVNLYFHWERIGNTVKVSFTVMIGQMRPRSIGDLTLINCKNKPVTIFEIVAVLDGKYLAPVGKFQPPLILKPLESLYVKTARFSNYTLGGKLHKADFLVKTKIYLMIPDCKFVECEPTGSLHPMMFAERRKLDLLTQSTTMTEAGHVYTELAKYVISYCNGGVNKQAFVLRSGVITGDWDLGVNMLHQDSLASTATVKAVLLKNDPGQILGAFDVDELEHPNYVDG